MKDNIELQQEFENLISELSTLKKINELTSSNSESAQNVVMRIGNLTEAISELETNISTDFKNKSEQIDGLINRLLLLKSEFESTQKNVEIILTQKIDLKLKSILSISENIEKDVEGMKNDYLDGINSLLDTYSEKTFISVNETKHKLVDGILKIEKSNLALKENLPKDIEELFSEKLENEIYKVRLLNIVSLAVSLLILFLLFIFSL